MFWAILKHLFLKKPEIIFTAEDHLNVLVFIAACITLSKSKIAASSRVTPYDTYSNIFFSKKWFLKQFFRLFKFRADLLTCVSKDMIDQYTNIFGKTGHKAIYNIARFEFKKKDLIKPKYFFLNKKKIQLVAAGMLAKWKGFDDLILAINILIKKYKIKLIILGNGPERKNLLKLIKKLNLSDKISLVGMVTNPYAYYLNSDIFVLSSKVEGMPNVLIKSMICGCTPVSTNCPTGPRELLGNGKYGYLAKVNNPKSLALAIEKAIKKKISTNFLQKKLRYFTSSYILKQYSKNLNVNLVNSNKK